MIINRKTSVTMRAKARVLFNASAYIEARDLFLRILESDPENSVALNGYATCLCELNSGQWTEEAVGVLLRALRADPKNAGAWNNVGDFYSSRGELSLAIEYFKKAIEYDAKCQMACVNLAIVYRTLGRFEEAFSVLAQALMLEAHCAWIRYQVSLTYLARGFQREEPDDFEKAHQLLLSIRELNLKSIHVEEGSDFDVDRLIRLTESYRSIEENISTLRRILGGQSSYVQTDLGETVLH